jgi:ATP-dependent DNA helicase RecG
MLSMLTSLKELVGVGDKIAEQLGSAGLKTINDLVAYFPRKYDDYSNVSQVADIRPGLVTVKVKFQNIRERRARRGLSITEADAVDPSGAVRVIWFNQPYRSNSIKADKTYYLSGEFALQRQRLQIVNPSIELDDTGETSQTARILPTYRETANISSVLIRKLMVQVVPVMQKLPETLPSWSIKEYGLISYADALRAIHLPGSSEELEAAKKRLGFEELFVLIMATKLLKEQNVKVKAVPINFDLAVAKKFVANLPFKLTDAQRKTIWQIYKDIDSSEPMNRLVEGDVGSGKTVVAAMAGLMVANAYLQVAFIAPTQLLAQQHADTIAQLLAHSPLKSRVALLSGVVKSKGKVDIKQRLANNEISILIGTHALLQESLDWHKLGLIIIDEQHRFGVEQRQKLFAKAGHMPHVLCLTATPIPRSLALTVYGELDVSILDQAPKIRAGVETSIVSPNSKAQMFTAVEDQLKQGHQAYVVCPLISESEVLQAASAEKVYEGLKSKEFKNWHVGLLHGRLKPAEKDKIMADFKDHKIDVLVSTTVIEVGVDVPNATVMIIEDADRFGLAQLHQLRGRVGRAQHLGHCYLVMSDSKGPSKRMQAIASTNNGFELAELDLEIRGPGAIYGTLQHGALDLRIAKLTDTQLISQVRAAVKQFNERGEKLVEYKQIFAKVQKASKLTYLN